MPVRSGKEVPVHLVNLTQSSPEYQQVHMKFRNTGGTGTIIKIERVQNPHLYQQFMLHKKTMDRENPGVNNEMELFHGTSHENLNAITKGNFNRSFCGAHGEYSSNRMRLASRLLKVQELDPCQNCMEETK